LPPSKGGTGGSFSVARSARPPRGRLCGFTPLVAQQLPKGHKAVVVTFGGGARDEETFAPEGQENIPHMLGELIPQALFLRRW
jgi:hypothetical protein